jgi:threonylcarbamoyladenosine tRNA methylthiotransferase MtaB
VPAVVKQARGQALQDVGRAQAAAFRRRFVGQTVDVLWETRRASGEWSGLTDNYLRVFTADARDLHNRITPTHLSEVSALGLCGEVAPPVEEE